MFPAAHVLLTHSLFIVLSCYHVNSPSSVAPRVQRLKGQKSKPYKTQDKRLDSIKSHHVQYFNAVLLACYVLLESLASGLSLIRLAFRHACTQAGCSLYLLRRVEPRLFCPLSRHSQDASSQFSACRHLLYSSSPASCTHTDTWEMCHSDVSWFVLVTLENETNCCCRFQAVL